MQYQNYSAKQKCDLYMECVLSNRGWEVGCYFLIGRDERVVKTVSAPDLAPLNTEGAVLPIFSEERNNQKTSCLMR